MRRVKNKRFGAGRRRNVRKDPDGSGNYTKGISEEFGREKAEAETVRSLLKEKRTRAIKKNRAASLRPSKRRKDFERESEDESTRRYRSTDVFAKDSEFGFTYDNAFDQDEEDYDYKGFVESLENIDKDPYSDKEEWGRAVTEKKKGNESNLNDT
jgi:hypothetical protein